MQIVTVFLRGNHAIEFECESIELQREGNGGYSGYTIKWGDEKPLPWWLRWTRPSVAQRPTLLSFNINDIVAVMAHEA